MAFRFLTAAAFALTAARAFSAPVSPGNHVALAPDLAVNAKGEMALLWVDRSPEMSRPAGGGEHDNHLAYTDLYVSISRDGGGSFGAPVKVNHDSGVVWGQSVSRPRIVGAADGSWHVSYSANEIHQGLGKPALTAHYTRSTDGGASFEAPRRLSTLTDSDLSAIIHGGFTSAAAFAAMAAAKDGSVHVMWIDTRHMGEMAGAGALYTAVSRDGGKTFNGDTQLLADGVCPCCQMVAAPDADASVLLSLRHVTGDGTRQATIGRIPAGGGAMSTPVNTGGAPWKIDACPLKPTVIAINGKNVFTAVFNGGETNPGVYFSHSADGGANYARAVQAHPEARVSDAPSIAANDRYVLLAWHGKLDGARRIFTRMYDLNGKPAGAVNELPAGPENAQNPVVVTRPDGKFQIAYQQADKIHLAVLPAAPTEVAALGR